MSRGSGYITVECDGENCRETIDCEMSPLASGAWDDRHINKRLKNYNWTHDGDRDLCEDCSTAKEAGE